MNNDAHQTPADAADRMARSLRDAADRLQLDPIEPAVAHRRAVRRRRRRSTLAGLAGVVAVGAIGAVVAIDGGDDSIEFAAPEATAPPTSVADSGGDDADRSSTGSTPSTTPVTTPATLPVSPGAGKSESVFDSAESTALDATGTVQLLPWADGFLQIGVEYPPQPLSPLPDEITALFPDEVRALFPDGLPPTVQEATDALSEAGLLDEVTAVLAEHPEASEAIYATPAPPPVLRASFTTNGTEWRTVELDSPTTYPGQFRVSGDRLMTWATEYDEPDTPRQPPTASRLVVAWTDDLTTWTTVTHPLSVAPDSRPYVRHEVNVSTVAMVGDRWVAHVQENTWFDLEALLPREVLEEYSATGYGMASDDEGLTIERYDESGASTVSRTFTWAELGLEGNPEEAYRRDNPDGNAESRLLTAVLDGPISETPPPENVQWGTVFGVGDTFVFGGERVFESVDAATWSEITDIPFDYLNDAVPVDDGILLVGDGERGRAAFVHTADGARRDVTLPDLPKRYWLGGGLGSGSAAWVVELYDEPTAVEPGWEPVTIEVDHDGKRLSLTEGADGFSYTVTDIASGSILVDRTQSYSDGQGEGPWETSPDSDVGVFVARDDDGVEVARFPGDLIQARYAEVYEATETSVAPAEDAAAEAEAMLPDLWVVATADAEHWLVAQLPEPDLDDNFWPGIGAAVNGDRVIYPGAPDGFVVATLPSG